MADPATTNHKFRYPQDIRNTLQSFIADHTLDLDHVTLRKGSPHSLSCTKNDNSHHRALTRCAEDEKLLNSPRSNKIFPDMPTEPSVLKSINAIRRAMASSGKESDQRSDLYRAIWTLSRQSEKIAGDVESIEAVLALASDIEAFRGKGSQMAANEFARNICNLVYRVKERLPLSEITPDRFLKEDEIPSSAKDVVDCLERLAAHAFSRTQGPPVRSLHAGDLRATAWETLELVSEILRRPEHLAHALKVAADTRASSRERQGAIGFLVSYWEGEEPDEPTAKLLWKLQEKPTDRTFLVTVLQAQIELDLNSEFGAVVAVEEWEDAQEEE